MDDKHIIPQPPESDDHTPISQGKDGPFCPNCDSDDLYRLEYIVDSSGYYWAFYMCKECDYEWKECGNEY